MNEGEGKSCDSAIDSHLSRDSPQESARSKHRPLTTSALPLHGESLWLFERLSLWKVHSLRPITRYAVFILKEMIVAELFWQLSLVLSFCGNQGWVAIGGWSPPPQLLLVHDTGLLWRTCLHEHGNIRHKMIEICCCTLFQVGQHFLFGSIKWFLSSDKCSDEVHLRILHILVSRSAHVEPALFGVASRVETLVVLAVTCHLLRGKQKPRCCCFSRYWTYLVCLVLKTFLRQHNTNRAIHGWDKSWSNGTGLIWASLELMQTVNCCSCSGRLPAWVWRCVWTCQSTIPLQTDTCLSTMGVVERHIPNNLLTNVQISIFGGSCVNGDIFHVSRSQTMCTWWRLTTTLMRLVEWSANPTHTRQLSLSLCLSLSIDRVFRMNSDVENVLHRFFRPSVLGDNKGIYFGRRVTIVITIISMGECKNLLSVTCWVC